MAPHFVLEEVGKPFELEYIDRTHDQHKSPDYLALNPNGLIPVSNSGCASRNAPVHCDRTDWRLLINLERPLRD
ncbi:hypothetical protein [Burkholderia sp. JP2-270]|uniref:hypothetical protein n=1 Tax=Burkholderia sp. JP2-270 TaxID=2217913 RepID=UPI0026CB8DD9